MQKRSPNTLYIADVVPKVYSLAEYQVAIFSAAVDYPTVSICCKIQCFVFFFFLNLTAFIVQSHE